MKIFKVDIIKGIGIVLILIVIFFLPIESGLKVLFGIGWILWNSTLVFKWKRY